MKTLKVKIKDIYLRFKCPIKSITSSCHDSLTVVLRNCTTKRTGADWRIDINNGTGTSTISPEQLEHIATVIYPKVKAAMKENEKHTLSYNNII